VRRRGEPRPSTIARRRIYKHFADELRCDLAEIEDGRMNWLFDGHEPTQRRNLTQARRVLVYLEQLAWSPTASSARETPAVPEKP
jgi:hypothetical protein